MQNPKNLNSAVPLHSVATTRRVAVSHREVAFWNTMIGKKFVTAITGIALVSFVIGTGASPVYYGSGYLPAADYWRLGAIFGLIFLAVFMLTSVPLVLFLRG